MLLASAAWLATRSSREPISQAQFADHARTDAVMTSEVLRTLEKKALLKRLAHPHDARARQVVLTPAGRSTVKKAVRLVEATDARFFANPGPELRALGKLIREQPAP